MNTFYVTDENGIVMSRSPNYISAKVAALKLSSKFKETTFSVFYYNHDIRQVLTRYKDGEEIAPDSI